MYGMEGVCTGALQTAGSNPLECAWIPKRLCKTAWSKRVLLWPVDDDMSTAVVKTYGDVGWEGMQKHLAAAALAAHCGVGVPKSPEIARHPATASYATRSWGRRL